MEILKLCKDARSSSLSGPVCLRILVAISISHGVHAQAPPRAQARTRTPAKAPQAKMGQVMLEGAPVLAVTDGTASGTVKLVNNSGVALTARLGIRNIQNEVTQAPTYGSLKVEGGSKMSDSDTWELAVPANGTTATITITAAQGWQPGVNEADVTEGANPIGKVKLENLRASLDKIMVPEGRYMFGPKEWYPLQRQSNLLQLKSDDKNLWFPLKWRLMVDGKPSSSQNVVLRPGETIHSELPGIPGNWEGNLMKDVDKDGAVEVSLQSGLDGTFPSRTIPIKIRIMRGFWPYAASTFIIFALILLGALLSYGVNAVLPNLQKAVGMKRDVTELDRRISGISDRIDSRLRVLIEVEMRRLRARANATMDALTPNFSDRYTADRGALDSLKARLEHIELLDTLRAQFNGLPLGNLPPKVVFAMDTKLQVAADLLRQVRPSQGDLENARATLLEAAIQMKSLGTGGDISDELTVEAKTLKDGLSQLTVSDIEEFLGMVPALVDFPDFESTDTNTHLDAIKKTESMVGMGAVEKALVKGPMQNNPKQGQEDPNV